MRIAMSKDTELISYKSMEDEEVVAVAKKDNILAIEYLIIKYQDLVKGKARSYFLVGADNDDIIQEGFIGLYNAIQDFDKDKLTTFKVFAEICVTRQIITAIKTATRQKHIPLNSYISLNKPIYDEYSENTLLDMISGVEITDPEHLLIIAEELIMIKNKTEEVLSELELRVLMLYINGLSYEEIAFKLDRHIKSIDNALQRIKIKLDKHLKYNVKFTIDK